MLALSAIWAQCFITSAMMRPLPKIQHSPDPPKTPQPAIVASTTSLYKLKLNAELSSSSLNINGSTYNLKKAVIADDLRSHRSDMEIVNSEKIMVEVEEDSWSEKFIESVRNSFDLKAFLNVYVLLFSIVQLLIVACTINPIFIPQKCEQDGISKQKAAIIVAMGGIGDTAGRFILGLLGLKVDNTCLFIVTVFMSGIPMVINSFCNTFWPVMFMVMLGNFFWGE